VSLGELKFVLCTGHSESCSHLTIAKGREGGKEGGREGGREGASRREGGRNMNSSFQPLPSQVAISCFEYDSFDDDCWQCHDFGIHDSVMQSPPSLQVHGCIQTCNQHGRISTSSRSNHFHDQIGWSD
jgi:hypothetical protein